MPHGKIGIIVFFALCFAGVICAEQEYAVRKGDNLYNLAKRFNTSVAELKRLNGLTGNRLSIGQKLVLSSVETESNRTENQGSVYSAEKVYHKVYRGETLIEIAKKHGVSVAELKKKNNLSGTMIKPGQRLLVKTNWTRMHTVGDRILESADDGDFSETAVEMAKNIPADGKLKSLIDGALAFLGTPYRLGGNGQKGIDCSGLTKKAFDEIGVKLPRTAREQFAEGEPISEENLSAGDLVFFSGKKSRRINHVGLYLGNGLLLHASSGARKVVVDSFDKSSYLQRRFAGARRIVDSNPDESSDTVTP